MMLVSVVLVPDRFTVKGFWKMGHAACTSENLSKTSLACTSLYEFVQAHSSKKVLLGFLDVFSQVPKLGGR